MQGSAGSVGRNRRFPSTPLIVKSLLFGRRTASTCNDKQRVIAFAEGIEPSGPWDQLRMQVPETGHYGKFNSLESAALSRQKNVMSMKMLSLTVPYSHAVPGPKTANSLL